MTQRPVKDQLWLLLRRKRDAQLWTGLMVCWLAGCLLALALLGLGKVLGWLPVLALPALILATVAAAFVYWRRYRRLSPDWSAAAQDVEQKYPELDGRLLTAVEQQPDSEDRFSYLQRRLFEEVLAHNQMVRWVRLFPKSRVNFLKLAHALAFSAFLVVCFKLGSLQYEKLGSANAVGGVVITPGDTSLERGNSLVVMVRFNAQVPASVNLVVHKSGEESQRIPLVRSMDDPLFGGSVPEVAEDLEYSVEYGSHRSRDFEVTVFDYPRMERADADLIYPDYTALAPKRIEDTRYVSAVSGSLLDLTLQLNKPVASAQLIPQTDQAVPVLLETSPERPEVQLKDYALMESGSYLLQLIDEDGRTNKQPARFSFNVLTNRTPEVKIASPRGDIRPSALEEVSFAGTIQDDFGVIAYGLAFVVGGQDMQTIELGERIPAGELKPFEHTLQLEDLNLEPGDLVSWFFWSEDIGPDGEIRRNLGDLYFAEVRPFDEIFRQGQPQFGGEAGQQQQQQGGGGGQSARLAELQQQIIHATWKLQRERGTGRVRGTSDSPQSSITPSQRRPLSPLLQSALNDPALVTLSSTHLFAQVDSSPPRRTTPSGQSASRESSEPPAEDIDVIIEAQRDALAQAQEAMQRQDDPVQLAHWAEAIRQMETALEQLTRAVDTPEAFQEALSAQQAAYQRLLKLQEREFSVSRDRNQSNSGSQSGNQRQRQRQLDQLELTAEENRYETERLARAPQSAEQREQLQIMSRLSELARRQQDLNERMQEMQTALESAQTEQEREQLRRELKRLQEEQRQMLADVDEMRQQMESGQNPSQFSEQQQQLEQTRESIQRAAEAAEQGALSQALAAGTRAQREMQQMRENLRNQSASAFAEDMRELRSQARELMRNQEELQEQIESSNQRSRRSLGDSGRLGELQNQFEEQRERLTNLVDQATQVSQLAEQAEPLMASELYDTLREFSQDDLGAVKEVQEKLLANGMFNLYEQLKEIAENSDTKTLDMTATVLNENMPELANQAGQRAQQDINDLARGIERAAELVLGDDTEALRLAQSELEDLAEQLRQETERETGTRTNSAARGQASLGTTEPGAPQSSQEQQASANGGLGQGQRQALEGEESDHPTEADSSASLAGNNRSNQSQNGGQGQRQGEQPTDAQANSQGQDGRNPQSGAGGDFDFNQFFREGTGAGTRLTGPITGDDFGPWAERLRAVEEMVESPELRNELIRAREEARQWRRSFTRDQQKPDWAQIELKVLGPLVEVHQEISEELTRRQSRESLVPIDRDPVPDRYSELVRRYYEELGRDRE